MHGFYACGCMPESAHTGEEWGKHWSGTGSKQGIISHGGFPFVCFQGQRYLWALWASQVAHWVKNLTCNAGGTEDVGSIPGSGRSPRRGNGNPLQCSCLRNPTDRPGHNLSDWACTVGSGMELLISRTWWLPLGAGQKGRMGILGLHQLEDGSTGPVKWAGAGPEHPM